LKEDTETTEEDNMIILMALSTAIVRQAIPYLMKFDNPKDTLRSLTGIKKRYNDILKQAIDEYAK
jgi:hypothetical protein